MPILIAVLLGAALVIVLVRSGLITTPLLLHAAYGVLGGILGIMILRFLIGPLGLAGAIIGALIGGVVILTFVRQAEIKQRLT